MRLSSTPSSNSLRRTPTYRGGVCAPCSSVPLVQMSVVVSPSPPAACLQGLWAGMLIAWAPMLLLLRRSWEKLQDAIQQIFNENAGELSFEELYRTGYNMVLHKHGDMLYQNVETVLKERSGALCEKVAQNTDKTLVPPPDLRGLPLSSTMCLRRRLLARERAHANDGGTLATMVHLQRTDPVGTRHVKWPAAAWFWLLVELSVEELHVQPTAGMVLASLGRTLSLDPSAPPLQVHRRCLCAFCASG